MDIAENKYKGVHTENGQADNLPKTKEAAKYREVAQRLKVAKHRAAELEETLEELIIKIVKEKDEESKKGLIAQRKVAVEDYELVNAEIAQLKKECKTAYLAIYELQVFRAHDELKQLIAEETELRQWSYQTEQAMRHGLRAELLDIEDREERDRRLVEVETEIAKHKAVAVVNQQNLARQRNTIRRCEMELSNAIREVENW